jgi:hypothetical protein
MLIDTNRFTIYQTPTKATIKNDIINALLGSCIMSETTPRSTWTFIFRSPSADYKLDMNTFDKRDIGLLKNMLTAIGKPSPTSAKTDEEAGDSVDDFAGEDETSSIDNEISELNDTKNSVPNMDGIVSGDEDTSDPELIKLQERNRSVANDLKDTIARLQSNVENQDSQNDDSNNEDKRLYNAKTLAINAQLISRINPDKTTVSNYETIAADLESSGNTPVENKIINNAAKELAQDVQPADMAQADNVTTSARELQIRKQVGQLKLNNVTFDTLATVTDTPLPQIRKPRNMTTTCPAALHGTPFTRIAKEYEDKLLDRDIVATFMNLSSLPDGFYVTNVEVTDISTVTSLMNNWKVTLKNKSSDKQSVINVRIPKIINLRLRILYTFNNKTFFRFLGFFDFFYAKDY